MWMEKENKALISWNAAILPSSMAIKLLASNLIGEHIT